VQIKRLHRPFLNLKDEVGQMWCLEERRDAILFTHASDKQFPVTNFLSSQLSQITSSFVVFADYQLWPRRRKPGALFLPYIQSWRLLNPPKQNDDRPFDINCANWLLLYHTAAAPGTEAVCCQIRPQRFFFCAPKLASRDFLTFLTSETARVVR